MTEIDAGLVRRKLATIVRTLDDLATVEALSLEEYRRDRLRQKGAERLLQETVEAAVDVNLHLLRAGGHAAATDYYTSFTEAGRHELIPSSLANELAPAAGLRNRLVHEYDQIDDAIILAAIPKARRLFAAYVAAVEQHLANQGF